MEFILHTIDFIHSPFKDKDSNPTQESRSQATGQVVVFPEFAEGPKELEGFSHIF
jgi:tRNA (Thr-GGU) A37 N-methylase